jgi:hypothetical protein
MLAMAVALTAVAAMPSAAAAKARDRNHDRIPDRWEKRHNLSTKVNQARRDQDHDGLRNRAEFEAGTNPHNPDTNGNGIPDGEEHAGKIASFDPTSGELTIDLFGGGTISGLVTEETEIECHGQSSEASASTSGEDGEAGKEDGNDESNEDEQQGDDGAEEEAGDDDQGSNDQGSSNCTTADLEPGATVDEAELKVENGMAVFEKVELAG